MTLHEYIADQQGIATRIAGLIDALLCLKDYNRNTADAEHAIAAMAQELAEQLSRNLDTVSLPEIAEIAGGAV